MSKSPTIYVVTSYFGDRESACEGIFSTLELAEKHCKENPPVGLSFDYLELEEWRLDDPSGGNTISTPYLDTYKERSRAYFHGSI